MNDTLWWDGIDGDNLACRPGNESYDLCLLVTRIMPSITAFLGICFVTMAWILLKLTRKIQADTDHSCAASAPTARKRKGKHSSNGNHGAIFALVIGVAYSFTGWAFIFNGHGTIVASDTIPGRIGDACCKFFE